MKYVARLEEVIIRVTPSVLFSLLPVSISSATSLLTVDFYLSPTFFSISSPSFLWLMKGFICHRAGDECSVFHPDLYSVTNEISAMLLHASTTKTEPWVKLYFKTLFSVCLNPHKCQMGCIFHMGDYN